MRIPAFIPGTWGTLSENPIVDPKILAFPFGGSLVDTLDIPTANTWFPQSMTVNKCVEFFWRVEAWRLGVDVSGESGIALAVDLNPTPGSTPEIMLRARPKAGTDERTIAELSANSVFQIYDNDNTPSPTDSKSFTSSGYDFRITDVRFYFLCSDSSARRPYQLQKENYPTDLLIPTIGFYARIAYRPTGSGSNEYAYTGYTYDVVAPVDIEGFCEVGNPTEFTLQMPFQSTGEIIPAGEMLTDITFYVTPYKYWPYDKSNGTEPIWDDDTGAQLRDTVTGKLL